uniref:Major facilitator superfamily (MFS) profile domain-containing protein n=1 Tax=Oryza barthii TaxID=65489 RepID=A0A0D3H647_9ORYZ
MAVTAALNGVGLALQIPAIYAFVADSVDGTSRGVAFGWLMVAGKVGTVGGTSLGLLMAPTSFLGIPGWRLAFLLLAAAGAVVGVSIRSFAAGNDAAAAAAASTTTTAKPAERRNAASLARALYTAIAVPMVLCCLIYSFLYCTYPRDREAAARAEAAVAARGDGGARPDGGEGSDTEDEGEDERKLLPQ